MKDNAKVVKDIQKRLNGLESAPLSKADKIKLKLNNILKRLLETLMVIGSILSLFVSLILVVFTTITVAKGEYFSALICSVAAFVLIKLSKEF